MTEVDKPLVPATGTHFDHALQRDPNTTNPTKHKDSRATHYQTMTGNLSDGDDTD